MTLFQKKFFGLDISDFSLKAVLAEKTKDGFVAKQRSCFDLEQGIIEKGELKNEKALANSVINCLKKAQDGKLKIKNIVCSLPEEKSFVDVFSVPLIEQKEELEQVVLNEAESRIPFPLNEVYYDFELLPNQSPSKINQQEVFLAACPKKVVDPYFQSLKSAGLFLLGMEIESLSIARAIFSKKDDAQPTLVIDIGENKTSFFVFFRKAVRLTSTIPCSARTLTLSLAQALKTSEAEANKLKEKEGLLGKAKGLEAMVPALNLLAEKIKDYLSYYKSHLVKTSSSNKLQNVEKILLCGGGANLKGLPEFLAEQLKIKVSLANPLVNFNQLKQNKILKVEKDQALSLATALGLSQREIYVD